MRHEIGHRHCSSGIGVAGHLNPIGVPACTAILINLFVIIAFVTFVIVAEFAIGKPVFVDASGLDSRFRPGFRWFKVPL